MSRIVILLNITGEKTGNSILYFRLKHYDRYIQQQKCFLSICFSYLSKLYIEIVLTHILHYSKYFPVCIILKMVNRSLLLSLLSTPSPDLITVLQPVHEHALMHQLWESWELLGHGMHHLVLKPA